MTLSRRFDSFCTTMVSVATIKCYYSILYSFSIMAQAYENALTTGQVVVRKWWVNTNSTKNQITVQFQQEVERPASAASSNSLLISLEQGTEALGNTTRVTALRSFNADKAAAILGSREGDATMGSKVMFANDFYAQLGAPADTKLAVQVTENFEKNPYSNSQQPKINPSTGEVVVAHNPATGTEMPVYRHTDLVIAQLCKNKFITATETPAESIGTPVFEADGLMS